MTGPVSRGRPPGDEPRRAEPSPRVGQMQRMTPEQLSRRLAEGYIPPRGAATGETATVSLWSIVPLPAAQGAGTVDLRFFTNLINGIGADLNQLLSSARSLVGRVTRLS